MKRAETEIRGNRWFCGMQGGWATRKRTRQSALSAALVLVIAGMVAGCGGYSSSGGGGTGGGIAANITNPVSTVQPGATYTFSATTPSSNGYSSGITWTLSPNTGAGTLTNATDNGFSSSVTYTAPANAPSPNSITVTATPSDSRVRAASDTFTIAASAMSMLQGPIAFEFSGSAANGESMSAAGSLVADGAGNISSGSMDVNRNLAPSVHIASVAGGYTVDSNLKGHIIVTAPGAGKPLEFSFVLAPDHQSGTISGSDANGFSLAGRMIRQDPAAFTLAQIASDFAFKLESNAADRVATVGKLTVGSNSLLTGIADQSKAGVDPVMESASVAGHVTAPPDSNGRGTFNLATPAGNSQLVFYVASDSRLMLLETDTGGTARSRQAGMAERQALPFSAATANGSGQLQGFGFDVAPSVPGPVSIKGSLAVQNLSHATLSWDAVSHGATVSIDSLRSDLFTFDPSTGRGTIRIANGAANNFADSVAFYLAGPGEGFFVDTTAGRFNRAVAGDLEPAAKQ